MVLNVFHALLEYEAMWKLIQSKTMQIPNEASMFNQQLVNVEVLSTCFLVVYTFVLEISRRVHHSTVLYCQGVNDSSSICAVFVTIKIYMMVSLSREIAIPNGRCIQSVALLCFGPPFFGII